MARPRPTQRSSPDDLRRLRGTSTTPLGYLNQFQVATINSKGPRPVNERWLASSCVLTNTVERSPASNCGFTETADRPADVVYVLHLDKNLCNAEYPAVGPSQKLSIGSNCRLKVTVKLSGCSVAETGSIFCPEGRGAWLRCGAGDIRRLRRSQTAMQADIFLPVPTYSVYLNVELRSR